MLTEPQVIADSETKLAKRSLYRRGHTSTRYHIITFLQTELARHASVKEMGFGIGGNNIPLSIDQNVSVASFLALSGSDMETSKTQPEPVFHCHLSECRHCGPCYWLRQLGGLLSTLSYEVCSLWKEHHAGALCLGLLHQRVGLQEVSSHVAGHGHLSDRSHCSHATGRCSTGKHSALDL